ncbi:unnamed protein product [Caenorhabditis sp. 36 PRJEB53466]|nr:unnamed protein product [Caenorhabditis sp. 36 PRJEB53466]
MSNNVSVDLSLEEIMKKNKTQKIGKKLSGGNEKRFGQKGPATIRPRRRSGGFQKKALPPTVTLNEKRNVRVNMSNLAPSVTSEDLRELFADFHIRSLSVHFNENGKPVGTGDISISKREAERLVYKFSGAALDGKPIKFAIIDIANRVEFTTAPTRNIGRKEQKSAKGSKKNGKRTEKPMKTTEQLDAELAAYMGKTEKKSSRKEKKQKLTVEQLDAEMEEYMAKRTKSGPTEEQLLDVEMDQA